MPHKKKKTSTVIDSALAKDFKQAHLEGLESLTKRSLKNIRNAVIERLKVVDEDDDVKQRAIKEDIFPIARIIFPDNIKMPGDVDAKLLTDLFAKKANDKDANKSPLKDEILNAIKELSQAWRKNFGNIGYRGVAATITSGGKDGLKYRTSGKKPKSLGTKKFWPELDFTKQQNNS